jgi:predicted transcriptional regulator
MTERTISLRSELVERLERLAQGRNLNEVLNELLQQTASPVSENWALAVAEGMEAADIEWLDEPDASTRSRERFEQHLREKWLRTQTSDTGDNG